MKLVFLGSSNFALKPLEELLASEHEVLCVVTQPDRKKGRGLHIGETAVKELAQKSNIRLFQPSDINAPESLDFLQKLNADLFVVIAYGQLLSQPVLDLPRTFPLNVHASLLPKYRGAAPIHWALIKGEKETGATAIKMVKKMDAGPVLLQKAIGIEADDNALRLEEKLSRLSASLLLETIGLIGRKRHTLTDQNEAGVSFAPKLAKEDGLIDWSQPAESINNLIRGCYGWPGAYTYYKGKMFKIRAAKVIRASQHQRKRETKDGQIAEVSKEAVMVQTGRGLLQIENVQIEGRRAMSSSELVAGRHIRAADSFSSKK